MRYTDNLPYTHGTHGTPPTLGRATYPPQAVQPTNEDIINHLIRIETRLVKLMYHSGLEANGRVRDEA